MLKRLELPATRRIVLALTGVLIALHLLLLESRHPAAPTDFELSRELGRRFLAGEPLYRAGSMYPYPPSAAMYFAPLALLAPGAGLAARYLAAVGCLWLVLRMLYTMVREQGRDLPDAFVTGALTVVLASHYIIRDLDVGGPNLIVLAMLVGAFYCSRRGKMAAGAALFGLAAAVKVTPALFIPFCLWKRRWKLGALTLVATLFFLGLPTLRMGPAAWWSHQQLWAKAALDSTASVSSDIYMSLQSGSNQALRTALLRYLGPDPQLGGGFAGQRARGRVTGLDLGAARRLATIAAIALLAAFLWRTRRPLRTPTDPAWLTEASGVLILMPLLSPITWVHHLVMIIPALYLIVAEAAALGGLGKPSAAAMGTYVVLALLLNREFVGKRVYLALMDYHLHTICMLLVLGVLMLRRRAEPRSAGATPSP